MIFTFYKANLIVQVTYMYTQNNSAKASKQ